MNLHTLESTDSWAWPDEAGDYLMGVLRDPAALPDDALLAAELAGDFVVASDAMAQALLDVLLDRRRPEPVRHAAAASLGPMLEAGSDAAADEFYEDDDYPAISLSAMAALQAALKALYDDPGTSEPLRRAALEASVRDPSEWHPAAIRAAYDSPAEASQVSAMFCMGYVRGFDNEILAGLRHDNDELRYHAVVAAGNAALAEAWDDVVDLVDDETGEKSLRMAAIDSVAGIRPEEAYEVLHALLEHEDEDIAHAAREALTLATALDLDEEEGEGDDDGDDEDAGRDATLEADDANEDLAEGETNDGGVDPAQRRNGHHRS